MIYLNQKGTVAIALLVTVLEGIKQAIREIENERRDHSYNHEKIDVKAYLSDEVQKKPIRCLRSWAWPI